MRTRTRWLVRALVILAALLATAQPALGAFSFFRRGDPIDYERLHLVVGGILYNVVLLLALLAFFAGFRRRWLIVSVCAVQYGLVHRAATPADRAAQALPSTATARRCLGPGGRSRSASHAPTTASNASPFRRPSTRRIVVSSGACQVPASGSRRTPRAARTGCGASAAHSPMAVRERAPASTAAAARARILTSACRRPLRPRGSGTVASRYDPGNRAFPIPTTLNQTSGHNAGALGCGSFDEFPFSNRAPVRTRATRWGCVDGAPAGLCGFDKLERPRDTNGP
jgi:hypothetical protein